jgi:hypothetical protein
MEPVLQIQQCPIYLCGVSESRLVWQNLLSYWAHMHLSLSQRPQTAMHVHQIT